MEIDVENSIFWDEVCGSIQAKELGIKDDSEESLKRFDQWYFNHYPYLLEEVPVSDFSNLNVLEVGLGYGTLSQRLALNSNSYVGLDIAKGPVNMVNKRMGHLGLNTSAIQGSILQAPFDDNSFDIVVAIGCFHHTGNFIKAIEETSRILKPGGKCYLMVYNKYSLANWMKFPFTTTKDWFFENTGVRKMGSRDVKQRALYDVNLKGDAAPETQIYSSMK